MRSMLCLSALVLVLPMSGCGRTDVGDLAGDQRSTGCGSVTLLAASAFHAKMEVLCSQKGLDLLHVGPLGRLAGAVSSTSQLATTNGESSQDKQR